MGFAIMTVVTKENSYILLLLRTGSRDRCGRYVAANVVAVTMKAIGCCTICAMLACMDFCFSGQKDGNIYIYKSM